MSIVFPSIDFLEALQAGCPEGSAGLGVAGCCDALFGIEVGHFVFTVEFEEQSCVAVALGGNPNDMDFVLSGPTAAWQKLFGGGDFSSLVRRDGEIGVAAVEPAGYERFEACAPALERFFAKVSALDWHASA